jgi:hypothetical protein
MPLEVEFSHIARQEMKMMQVDKDHTCYPFTMIVIKTRNECSKFPTQPPALGRTFLCTQLFSSQAKSESCLRKKKIFQS